PASLLLHSCPLSLFSFHSSAPTQISTLSLHDALPILLGTSDSSQALGHIPGSVLRGALVQAYLQATGKPAEELETEDIFDPRKVDRKSTRLNSSHVKISYAVFCLKKKKANKNYEDHTS